MDNWRFYQTESGAPVARDELAALPLECKAALISVMKRFARGDPLLADELEKVEGGLWALRAQAKGLSLRLYFTRTAGGGVLLALHVLDKRTRAIPKNTLEVVRSRAKDWDTRGRRLRQGQKRRKKG